MESQLILQRLFALQDLSYQSFQGKLVPTIAPETIIGVRVPELRRFAREIRKTQEASAFLRQLPHRYYDENILHGLLISQPMPYGEVLAHLDAFLPYVDNWAVCDLISPQAFQKHPPDLPERLRAWMTAEHPYTVRFAVGALMGFYLDDAFRPEYAGWVSELQSGEYYINMMIAWYFATALAKRYEEILPYLEERRLSDWVHNKTIQKAVESYRIAPEQKAYLRTLRIKASK